LVAVGVGPLDVDVVDRALLFPEVVVAETLTMPELLVETTEEMMGLLVVGEESGENDADDDKMEEATLEAVDEGLLVEDGELDTDNRLLVELDKAELTADVLDDEDENVLVGIATLEDGLVKDEAARTAVLLNTLGVELCVEVDTELMAAVTVETLGELLADARPVAKLEVAVAVLLMGVEDIVEGARDESETEDDPAGS
jgi:hypothetical protein